VITSPKKRTYTFSLGEITLMRLVLSKDRSSLENPCANQTDNYDNYTTRIQSQPLTVN